MNWCKSVATVLVVFSFSTPITAFSAVDLGWDLTYQRALAEHPIDEREFMHVWVARYPQRIIHQQLSQYDGPAIKASLLFEKPDSHTGDPMAMWFVRTEESAYSCRMHRKIEGSKFCSDLDAGRVQAFIEAAIALKPLAKQNNPEAVMGRGEDQVAINYYGFLSVYLPDKTLQRPLASIEIRPGNLDGTGTGRFIELMIEHLSSAEEKAAHQAKTDKRVAKQRLISAARLGDADTVTDLLDEGVTDQPEPGRASPGSLLSTAARYGHKHIVDLLLERGYDINYQSGAAMRAAIYFRRVDMVKHLLERGAKTKSPLNPLALSVHRQSQSTRAKISTTFTGS